MRHRKPLLFLYATFGSYFILLFSRMLEKKPSGIWAGHVNVWSDWSLHLAITNLFASKSWSEWFLYHPYFAHGKFTYPFLTNLIPALFVKLLGMPLETAIWFSSAIYSMFLIAGLYALGFLLLRKPWTVVLGIALFFFSSGPGFYYAFKDFLKPENFSFQFLLYPTKDYSRLDSYQWYAGNVITGLLAPQRGFLLGMTLGSLGFASFLRGIEKVSQKKKSAKSFWIAALLIGLLPISHMHTLIALTPAFAVICLFNYRNYKKLFHFVIPCSALVLTLYFRFISGGIENPHFMNWAPGYSSGWNLAENTSVFYKIYKFFWLWAKIWGVFLPVAFLAFTFFWKQKKEKEFLSAKIFFSGLAFMFLLGNLILFQPVAWDNSKIFFWAYFGGSLLCAHLLTEIWQNRSLIKSVKLRKTVAASLFLLLSLTGIWELVRLQQIEKHQFQMTGSDDMALGLQIKQQTQTDAVFLTASDHNHWVMMWGARSILLGFTPWVWNYGFLYDQREKDQKEMFERPALNKALFEQYKISYIVLGPSERHHFKIDETYFQNNWELKFNNNSNFVYFRKH